MNPLYAEWYDGKTFSTDWTSRHLGVWEDLLLDRRMEPLRILEIGSWEGRSAVFFMRYFPNSHLTCIDTFAGSAEHHLREKWSSQLSQIEDRFDANLLEFRDRIEKLKTTSFRGLARLVVSERMFDIVFIDGSHHSADVMADAVLTWPMVKDGGVVIFDDYDWNQDMDEVLKPRLGVDAFLATRPGQYRELHRDYQLIVEKTAG
jgi:predicted O-methyltransferase YrrM